MMFCALIDIQRTTTTTENTTERKLCCVNKNKKKCNKKGEHVHDFT